MRHKITPVELLDSISFIPPERIIKCLKAGLEADRLDLETSKILKNEEKCRELRDRICDTEVILCTLQLRNLSG